MDMNVSEIAFTCFVVYFKIYLIILPINQFLDLRPTFSVVSHEVLTTG